MIDSLFRLPVTSLSLFFICSSLLAEDAVQIVYREQVTNFFAEQAVELHLDITATEAMTTRVRWSLVTANSAQGARTLANQEAEVILSAEMASSLVVKYKLPAVKEGVVFPLELRVAVTSDAGKDLAQLSHSCFIFSANPFYDRQEWLRSLHLHLFDPEEKTAAALDGLDVPYTRIKNLEALNDLKAEIVMIGEGVSWNEHGLLGKLLTANAARGLRIICLAPSAQESALPLALEERQANRLLFYRNDVLLKFDKRFSFVWIPQQSIQERNLLLALEAEAMVAKGSEPGSGWPWLEIQFEKPPGRLVWCGFGVIRQWDASPTPRYLLARMFESLAQETKLPQAASVPE